MADKLKILKENSMASAPNGEARAPKGKSLSDDSLYQRLGGEAKLRAMIRDFVGKVFADTMIGHLFDPQNGVNRQRVMEMEFQFAAAFLGAPLVYGGRPIKEAHARHHILGGQFARRRQILKETLQAYAVPEDIQDKWMAHTDALRGQVVGGPC